MLVQQNVTSTPIQAQPGGKHPLTPESKVAVESQPKRFAGRLFSICMMYPS